MATTLQILSKTPTSISLRGTKNQTNSMAMAVGPGNDYETIWANAAASQLVGSDQTGSFDVTFSSGLTSNTQYGAVAFLFGGGTGEVSSVLDGTLPSPALSSVSVNKLASNYAQMNFSMVADGGYYPRNVQYSLDNGSTWTTGYTASGGSAVSGQFITPLDLVANTAYTMQTRVNTTAGNTTSPSVSFTTLSAEPTITQEAATDTSVTIGYSFAADGGAFDKTIAYTVDGGVHWVQGVTVTGGGAATGNFTISNLQPNTSYNLIVRVTTGAGTITLDDMTITTEAIASDHHLLYAPLKFLDDMQGYTIEPIGSSPAAIESVNMPQFVAWIKSTSYWTTALNNGVYIERFDAYIYKALDVYTLQVVLVGKDGATHNWRSVTENSESAFVAAALANAGITVSTAGIPSIEKSSIVPTIVEYRYEAKTVDKIYGPVETTVVTGVTGAVRAGSPGIGAGIQFDGAVFWNKVENVVDSNKTMDYLQQRVGHGGDSHYLTLFYTDGTSYAFENGGDVYEALYGITYTGTPDYSGFDYIDLTATTALMSLSKRIKKLYGSVNGQARMIYPAFGHVDYGQSGDEYGHNGGGGD